MSEKDTPFIEESESGCGSRDVGSVIMLVFSDQGGLADYAHEQATELARRGINLTVLCKKRFAAERATAPFRMKCLFFGDPEQIGSKLLRQLRAAFVVVLNEWIAAGYIAFHRPRAVLKDGYSELMAPFWFLPHLILDRIVQVDYAVDLHDPDRKRIFGPRWWHRLSVRAAYSMVRILLVHDVHARGMEFVPKRAAVVEVPHGIFPVARCRKRYQSIGTGLRKKLGIPRHASLLLSFGFIADRKNIDVVIRALAKVPDAYLLVAGRVASARDRSVEQYCELARHIGVAKRVFFNEGYVPGHQVQRFFEAADAILLTYKSDFVSQSGVLHLAANWDKPVVAASCRGPLAETVARHNLGIVVEPDSVEALAEGLKDLAAGRYPALGWAGFRNAASWKVNIDRLLDALADVAQRERGAVSAHRAI